MKELILNETPVRTAKNYNINNIKIKEIKIPEQIEKFKNVIIKKETDKDTINENSSKLKLSYGIGKELIEQINNNSNNNTKITINSKTNKKIIMQYKLNKENKNLIENIEIIAKENTKSNIIIKYESEEDLQYYHNGAIRIKSEENSEVNVTIINYLSKNTYNFLSIENEIKNNSKINYNIIDFGGKSSITNYYTNIKGNNAQNNINTIYIGNENQLIDLNYIVELRGEKAKTNIEVQGALKDNAVKHFKGTIDFKKGSKKSKGNENEFCMLLSEKAKSIALPMLLCSEEDVEGNHSSSSRKSRCKSDFLYNE